METSIETLQDRIIYITGQIALVQRENISEISKIVVVEEWDKKIKELKEAQSILSNCDR